MKLFMQLDRDRVTTRKTLKMLRVEKQGRRVTFLEPEIARLNLHDFWRIPVSLGWYPFSTECRNYPMSDEVYKDFVDDYHTLEDSMVIFDRHEEQVLIQIYTPYAPDFDEAELEDGRASGTVVSD